MQSNHTLPCKSPIQDLNYLPPFLLWPRFVHLHFWGVVSWLDVGLVLGFHHFNPSLVSTNFASCYGYLVGGLGFRVSHPHHFLENNMQIIIHSLCQSVHKKAHNLWELSKKEIGTLLCLHHATFLFSLFLLGVETGEW